MIDITLTWNYKWTYWLNGTKSMIVFLMGGLMGEHNQSKIHKEKFHVNHNESLWC